MNSNLNHLRNRAICLLAVAFGMAIMVFALQPLVFLIVTNNCPDIVSLIYIVSFVMLIVCLSRTAACWLKYYHAIKPNKALRKSIVSRLVFSLVFLLSFFIPSDVFGKGHNWFVIVLRVLDFAVWLWVIIDWILYASKLPKTNFESNQAYLDALKENLVNFAFDHFLVKGKDYTVEVEIPLLEKGKNHAAGDEIPVTMLVRKIPRWVYCHVIGDKKVRALFSIETDKGIYCFQVDEEKFKLVDTEICTSIYPQLLPKEERERQEKGCEDEWEKKFVSKEFQNYLQQFEHLSKNAVELVSASKTNQGFSKFGGLPIVPSGFVWPKRDDISLQFVAQFDFAEINANGTLKDFPTTGLMYLFVCENPCEREDGKVLFFEKNDKLSKAKKPDDLEMVYKEIYLGIQILKTYPSLGDCNEADQVFHDNPQDFMKDIYERYTWTNMEKSFVGGWGSYLQDAYFLPEQEHPEDWVLLCQINSDPNSDDDGFMWGDAGVLYLYIKKTDLQRNQFENVKLDLQCG